MNGVQRENPDADDAPPRRARGAVEHADRRLRHYIGPRSASHVEHGTVPERMIQCLPLRDRYEVNGGTSRNVFWLATTNLRRAGVVVDMEDDE